MPSRTATRRTPKFKGVFRIMQLTLAPVFTDNMVLQQGMPVPVWGMTEAGATVTVRFAGQEKKAKSAADGRWLVRLAPLSASSAPQRLEISAQRGRGRPVRTELQNVLVGEVWICSGQSNMEWPLSLTRNAEAEIAGAAFPGIRLCTVPKRSVEQPATDIPGCTWSICAPDSVPTFSAVGYLFGRELHSRLGVPIGLINSSWGGTVAEAWVSREGLLGQAELREMVEKHERDLPNLELVRAGWRAEIAKIEERTKDTGDTGWPRGWADLPESAGVWQDMDLPSIWQSRGLNFSGILWFRKTVEVPDAWAGKDLRLAVGATDKSDITYFNNVKVGSVTIQERPDAWSFRRTYTVPGSLVRAGRNVIAVRVHSDKFAGGMTGPADSMHLCCPELPETAPMPLAGSWRYAIEATYGLVQLPPEPPGPGNPNYPSALFNGMISPLCPFAMRGAIWYQGESNADRPRQYRVLFPTLIRDWRRALGQDSLAFYFVQLANYLAVLPQPAESRWAELREAQMLALRLPHTGMAVIIDIGDEQDIHPRNKQDVGLRLALNALHQTYGHQEVVPCGPLFKEARREGRAFRVTFDHVGGGLECRGKELQGFAVAGADGKFVWAEAHLDGETVVVADPTVPDPVAVRYAWADNPVCNLYNRAGLPAAPFRSDVS